MNPYNQTSYNQQSNLVEGTVAVAAMSAAANTAWNATDKVREAVASAMGYGPQPASGYSKLVQGCSDILTIGGAAMMLGSAAYHITKGMLNACADVYDACTGNNSKKEAPQSDNPVNPTRDPAYLNSRRS